MQASTLLIGREEVNALSRGCTKWYAQVLSNYYIQPQIEDRLIISDCSLIPAIGCPQFWGDPSTCYLLAIIDIAQLLGKFKQFSCPELPDNSVAEECS